jgi:hypothetical protein
MKLADIDLAADTPLRFFEQEADDRKRFRTLVVMDRVKVGLAIPISRA